MAKQGFMNQWGFLSQSFTERFITRSLIDSFSLVTPAMQKEGNHHSRRALQELGYKDLGNIGKGGFSKVKLAMSEQYPNKVAIKIKDLTNESCNFVSKLLPRELDILRRVKHSHIIQVHNIHELPNKKVLIVMEVAEMNLYQKIKKFGRMPTDQARTVFSQLVSAVSYLHQQDIVHRDLKCVNVLLTTDGQVKLTDFGFGRNTQGIPDLCLTFVGTYHYCPPEVLMHVPYDGKKSDVWSLGIILYFMVTSRLPFIGNRKNVSLVRLQYDGVKFPSKIMLEEPCQDLIKKMLCFNPLSRPSITDVQQHPWLQLCQPGNRKTGGTEDLTGFQPESPLDENFPETAREHEGNNEYQQQQHYSAEKDLKKDDLEDRNPSRSNGTLSSTVHTWEPTNVQHSKEITISRVMVRPEETGDVEDGQISGSQAGGNLISQIVEAVDKKNTCILGCCRLCTKVKRAAKKYMAAPVLRTARTVRSRISGILQMNSEVGNF